MKRRFRDLLFELHHLPIQEQYQQIDQILRDWQGDTEQTDDITILGVKLTINKSISNENDSKILDASSLKLKKVVS